MKLYRDTNNDGKPDGQPIATTTTATDGSYLFAALNQGSYIVEVVPPANYLSSTGSNARSSGAYEAAPDPDDDIDNDDNGTTSNSVVRSATVTLLPGNEPAFDHASGSSANPTVDVGLFRPLSLGNLVWEDIDNDGLVGNNEAGIDGITVNLYFDANANGTLDTSEATAVATTVTSDGGYYLFDHLIPGNYLVELDASNFADAAVLDGYASSTGANANSGAFETAPDADDNPTDSDDNGSVDGPRLGASGTIRSALVTLTLDSEPENESDLGNDGSGSAIDSNSNLTVDFGVFKLLSLGNLVWEDLNNNGTVDDNERGISGVTVVLYQDRNEDGTPDGDALATTTTDDSGNYLFTELWPGNYLVVIPESNRNTGNPLEDYNSSTGGSSEPAPDVDSDDDDNDDNGSESATLGVASEPVTLTPQSEPVDDGDTDSDTNLTVDFGFYQGASLGDYVWYDTNTDGIQDAAETGLSGVTVELYTPGDDGIAGTDDDVLVDSTVTSGDGAYGFTALDPGDYFVVFTPPTGHVFSPQNEGNDTASDSDAALDTGITAITTLVSGENDPTWDAGLYQLAGLGNYVWEDLDADGIQDRNESGIAGVTVHLYADENQDGTPDGAALLSTTTDDGGYYAFTDLEPGSYIVEFVTPDGYVVSNADQGSNDATDSDADSTNGRTTTITLAANETNPTLDAGFYQLASLGDRVWLDRNVDGLQDSDEVGISGVTVNLYTNDGTLVGSTSTDTRGFYAFTDVIPGSYIVEFVTPADYLITRINRSRDDSSDSDANRTSGRTGVVVLTSGEHDPTLDAGLYQLASIGDRVWLDTNANGIQDSGEIGVARVIVALYQGDGTLVGITFTDADGNYTFTNLLPGDYYVTFVPPSGYNISPPNAGTNDAADSDADPTTGATTVTTLDPGEDDMTWDIGLFGAASLGDYIWLDQDGDGTQDATEPGIEAVTVNLYQDSNEDNVADGTPIATTTTGATGYYQFTDLAPGSYIVEFITPEDYFLTNPDQGDDNAADSDADITTGQTMSVTLVVNQHDPTIDAGMYQPGWIGDYVWLDENVNGIQDSGEPAMSNITVNLYDTTGNLISTTTTNDTGFYQFIDLTPGGYIVEFIAPDGYGLTHANQGSDEAVDSNANTTDGRSDVVLLTSGEHNLDIDAGMTELASLVDRVWLDENGNGQQDNNEPGFTGVIVNLYDADGNLIDTTTTDADGNYAFTNLLPGDYYIEYTIPDGYETSTPENGDTSESPDGSTIVQTPIITLLPGENRLDKPIGLIESDGVGVSIDKTVSLATIAPNQIVTYTLTIRNTSDSVRLSPVKVIDTLEDGLTYVDGSASPQQPDVNGQILTWSDISDGAGMAAGEERVITFLASVSEDVGVYVNRADVEGTYPGGTVTDSDDVSLVVTDPMVEVNKGIVTPGFVNGVITFTISITNTGPSTLDIVPLTDRFFGPIDYIGGDPVADIVDQDNQVIAWNDLTETFGKDLAPGEAFHLNTAFRLSETSDQEEEITNIAEVTGAEDSFNNLASDRSDSVATTTPPSQPTAIQLLNFSATQQAQGVAIRWATGAEINTWGFHLLRSNDGSRASAVHVTSELIRSEGQRNSGAQYSWFDSTAVPGTTYTYWLQEVELDGSLIEYGPISTTQGSTSQQHSFFLPLIVR
ncbi:MAG: DUF11 domain-containing protein [Chloroflexaceae bacterium]|nr:DUF11 domain-containing protein [Chloroflexaceae bacterium]